MRERIAPVDPMHEYLYQNMFQGIPDLVYVLGGGVKDVPKDPMRYISPSYFTKGRDTVGGGFWRMFAASDLAHTFPDVKIITSGGTFYPEFIPSTASVMAHDLTRYGIDKERIEPRPQAMTTSMEIADVILTAAAFAENSESRKKIVVTTNDFHIPRARLMFALMNAKDFSFLPKEHYDDFEQFSDELSQAVDSYKDSQVSVMFVPAETIILVRHPDFSYGFERVHKNPKYQNTQRLERQGIEDLESGKYIGAVRRE